jgi:hypothetical protein
VGSSRASSIFGASKKSNWSSGDFLTQGNLFQARDVRDHRAAGAIAPLKTRAIGGLECSAFLTNTVYGQKSVAAQDPDVDEFCAGTSGVRLG